MTLDSLREDHKVEKVREEKNEIRASRKKKAADIWRDISRISNSKEIFTYIIFTKKTNTPTKKKNASYNG